MNKPVVRVLLVEDDHDDYVLTRDLLAEMTGQRYVLDWVSDYDAALKTMCRGEHDVYLLDYRLGLRTGLELLRKAEAKNCKGAAIMLTGQQDRDIDMAAMEAGAADYLNKGGLDTAQLERSIRYALQHKRHQEELEKRIEERTAELASANHFLNTLVKAAPMAVVVVEPDPAVVRLWNPAAESLFGWTEAEVVNRVLPIVPEEKQAECAEYLDAIKQGRTVEAETYLRRKHGSSVEVSLAASPLRDAEGRLTGILLLFANITERKRLDQVLQDKNAEMERVSLAKDRFLAGLSHELRTPLNAIIGFTGTLLMKLPGPLTTDQDKQLRTIQNSGRHLLSLINDLLDLAKIDSGKVEINLEATVCQDVINEVAGTLRPVAQNKGLELKLILPEQNVVFRTDRRAFSQILINLVNNAIKFTKTGEVSITLNVRNTNGVAWTDIHVKDTGIGISPEQQTKLFQAFAQLESSSTRQHEGTGLGLYLCQKLSDLIGGKISLQSEPHKGSTFTLSIEVGSI